MITAIELYSICIINSASDKVHSKTIEITPKLQSTLQQDRLPPPSQRSLPERSFERLIDRPDENELHLASYFGRNVVFDIFSICPRKNDLADLCPVGTKDFHPNAANGCHSPAERDLPGKLDVKHAMLCD